MRITFVVKGKDKDATGRKLAQYGLTGRKIDETRDNEVFEACPDDLERLAQWFCESADCVPRIGYPNGTLLIYSIHESRLVTRD